MNKFTIYLTAFLVLTVGLTGVFIGPFNGQLNLSSAAATGNLDLKTVYASMLPNVTGDNSLGDFTGQINVMITFNLSNQSSLLEFLNNLSTPNSPQYHKYLSASAFDHKYGPSGVFYYNAVNYFLSIGNVKVYTFSDHLSIYLSGGASYFNNAFHTKLSKYSMGRSWFYSVSSLPELPSWVAGNVKNVVGLSNYTKPTIQAGSAIISGGISTASPTMTYGHPAPVSYNGIQFVWGSDFQVAYNEQSLLNSVYPKNVSIATILWSGSDNNGNVAPFYPKDVYTYLNDTLGSGQPIPKIYGVPLDGAPSPGISATHDFTSAAFENTLDLEMAGSTAPGSNLYNVYTPNNSFASLDQCLAYIINANSTINPGLANVSVISNSWYSGHYSDLTWNQYLQEAQARGITVLASSGDSGDNTSSSKYLGADASFPGIASFNSYGMTSVGGSTVTLTTSQNQQTFLHISNQSAWYVPGPSQADKTSIGTQGGIDTNATEPTWQLNSVANNVIQGKGRGVPDIGAIANNTIMYMTVNGTSYYDNPSFYIAWGTSIASPLEAGTIAEMNAYMHLNGLPNMGFMNPSMYKLANLQYGTTQGVIQNSNHTFLKPFIDVLYGHNAKHNELFGYSLVTGLGTIDAYNMTMDLINNFTTINIYKITINIILGNSESITGVTLNGKQLPWTVTTFNLFLANGTYFYNITLKSQNGNSYSTGNFSVNGSSNNITLKLTNQTTIPTSPLMLNNPLLYFLALILVAILLISVLMRKKK